MRTLIIGSGGREHALAWRLRASPSVSELFAAPGNPGIAALAETVPIEVKDVEKLCAFAVSERIDLTVVGPELPLTLGIVDHFRDAGLRVFGPTRAAAELEASKSFAKEIMSAAGVPTARYRVVRDRREAEAALRASGAPIVLKSDGLAAGKGVVVCETEEEAIRGLDYLFGELGAERVVFEDRLEGREVSFIAATDGWNIVPFASSHDYKRIYEGDRGPNTGGMGSVSPTPRFTADQGAWVVEHVMHPVVRTMASRGTPFTGFLYAGLMIAPNGEISVLEFNARMGDPECQSIMRRFEGDLGELLAALAEPASSARQLPALRWSEDTAVCVVLAAAGYPEAPRSGDEITGIELAAALPGAVVFHAGTRVADGKLVTNGGRVLGVTATGSDLPKARALAHRASDMIQFRGRQARRDVGL